MTRSLQDNDILEHLTVCDGVPQYIESSPNKSQRTGSRKKSKNVTANRTEPTEEQYEGHHETHYEVHEEYCIHQHINVNQHITMCDINEDVTKCGSCPYRKSRTIRSKVTSISTKVNKP